MASIFARRSATNAPMACWLALNSVERGLTLVWMAVIVASRAPGDWMTRQQLIRMFPARRGPDALQPVIDARILAPVHAEFIGEKKIAACGYIRDREASSGEIAVARQMCIEDFPAGFSALAELLDHRRIRVGHQHPQEAICGRIAGELVVIP